MADLYAVVLYSLEDKVKTLKTDLNLREAKDFMNNYQTVQGTMIGLIPNPLGDQPDAA
tara:strand:- start:1318 stop:1491 length:174 start_codon:yes stop_codon:yes gene_type:complete